MSIPGLARLVLFGVLRWDAPKFRSDKKTRFIDPCTRGYARIDKTIKRGGPLPPESSGPSVNHVGGSHPMEPLTVLARLFIPS